MPKLSPAAQVADRVARATAAHRELLYAARSMVDLLDRISGGEFGRGAADEAHERLRAAVDRSNADAL